MEVFNENDVSKHDEGNLVPVMSLRQYYLNIGSLVEELENIEESFGDRDANIGFTVSMIRDLIVRHANDTVEAFGEEL